MVSDWWSHILVEATSAAPNLDHPTNQATLRRLASRFDVICIVDPFWHDVGSSVRDRLRTYASEQGRTLTLLRYMGTMYVQWHDQPGDMTVIPAQGRVSYDGVVANADGMLKAGGVPMIGRGNIANLQDPGSASLLAAAKTNTLTKAAGWDGIFIDEVCDYYAGFRANNTQVADGYPLTNLAYPNAKRDFVAALTAHLAANGKKVAANITPYVLPGGGPTYPQQVCAAAPALTYPYLEAEFGADWGRTRIGATSGSWATQAGITGFLTWCEQNGRRPIPNVYSNNPDVLSYGLGMFLAHAGPNALWSGACPEANENEEYMREPTWLPEYATANSLGAPVEAASGANIVRRRFEHGIAAVNPTATAQTVTLDGYYATATDTGRTPGNRAVPALTSLVAEGQDFGTYRQINGKVGRMPYVWGGGRWNRLIDPAATAGPVKPAGTVLVAETFDTPAATWPTARWATGMNLASSTATVAGGAGVLKVGTSAPGVIAKRFTGAQFADFHALTRFSIGAASTSLTVMLRSGDTTLDEDNAYGLRLWPDAMELISFDASWIGTTIATAAGKTHTTGQAYWLRLKAAGSILQARTWIDGDTEPTGWDINVTDSTHAGAGWFGFSAAGYGTTGPGATVTIDDLTVATS